MPAFLESLHHEGVLTAQRLSGKGQSSGAKPFTRGHLYNLLSNPIYIGRVRHKGVSHHGQHEAIIDMATWNAVQAQPASNTQGPRRRRRRAVTGAPLLAGLLVGADGSRFMPTHANKVARRYHYYVEEVAAGSTARRLPNTQIERAVLSAQAEYLQDHRQLAVNLEVSSSAIADTLANAGVLADRFRTGGPATQEALPQLVAKVVYRDTHLELHIIRDSLKIALGWRDGADLNTQTNQLAHDNVIVVSTPLSIPPAVALSSS